jgi:hypothetical protein
MGDMADMVSDSMLNNASPPPDVDSAATPVEAPKSTSAASSNAAGISGTQKVIGAFNSAQAAIQSKVSKTSPVTMPNNTYGALFGTQASTPAVPKAPPLPQAPPPMIQPQAPMTPIPSPIMLQAPPQLSAMSDRRAKNKIEYARDELDGFLQKIYNNVVIKHRNKGNK